MVLSDLQLNRQLYYTNSIGAQYPTINQQTLNFVMKFIQLFTIYTNNCHCKPNGNWLIGTSQEYFFISCLAHFFVLMYALLSMFMAVIGKVISLADCIANFNKIVDISL